MTASRSEPTLNSVLRDMGACEEAREWAATQPDARAAWRACTRGDWLLWLTSELRLSRSAHRLIAADIAESALLRERAAGREPDPRSRRAVDVARQHARGAATDAELVAARDSAWAAAWAVATACVTARYAAWAAASSLAQVAWDAAGNAADDAAGGAAWAASAASAVARVAARAEQADIVRRHLAEDDVIHALIARAGGAL